MSDLELITEAYSSGKFDESAEKLAGLLMDDSVSTYRLFEDIAAVYINGSPEKREGIDFTFCAITGMRLAEFAKEFAKENIEYEVLKGSLMEEGEKKADVYTVILTKEEAEKTGAYYDNMTNGQMQYIKPVDGSESYIRIGVAASGGQITSFAPLDLEDFTKEQISYAKDLMDKAAEQLEEHGIEFEEDEREM